MIICRGLLKDPQSLCPLAKGLPAQKSGGYSTVIRGCLKRQIASYQRLTTVADLATLPVNRGRTTELGVEGAVNELRRASSPPLEGTQTAATAIARVKCWYDAFMVLIISQPGNKLGEIAKRVGYTQ